MDTLDVRALVRGLLTECRLPRQSANRICASFGNGTSCEICGQPTQPSGVMYELRFGGGEQLRSIYMHIECFDLYEQERAYAALETPALP